jgi:SAM-dependent methyltransferase
MDQAERHAQGAHFTSEGDIMKIVLPTIVKPWQERIDAASSFDGIQKLRKELAAYQVLDAACGCGNFLYVAYREMKRLELRMLEKARELAPKKAKRQIGMRSMVSLKQFHGIDINPFAVELARVVMILGKEQVIAEQARLADGDQMDLDLEPALPLDNLDDNIVCDDALFCDWPKADAIIGNPPYQSKNKLLKELGADYRIRLTEAYEDVPGRADYCVYWFRKAHDQLKKNGRAGLVGTNTVRQTYSRVGGLDHVVGKGGTIIDAVSSQVWSGDAVVNVSIVNWIKGGQKGKKRLREQVGDLRESPWQEWDLEEIPPTLSAKTNVAMAKSLSPNNKPKRFFQGQTHGHEAFLLTVEEYTKFSRAHPEEVDPLRPYFVGEELLADHCPSRYVIDLWHLDTLEASRRFPRLIGRLQGVIPEWKAAAEEEAQRNAEVVRRNPEVKKSKLNWHHRGFLRKWPLMKYPRGDMLTKLRRLPRYIACSRNTKRPIFEFVSRKIQPSDVLQVFAFADDYSFGILQSDLHWQWFTARCSTLKRDFRYTSTTVWSSFPWPQAPTLKQALKVAQRGRDLRELRNRQIRKGMSLRQMYRTLDYPGKNPLRDAMEALDAAVRHAYGMPTKADILGFLLTLNLNLADLPPGEVIGPGLPPGLDLEEFMSEDRVSFG